MNLLQDNDQTQLNHASDMMKPSPINAKNRSSDNLSNINLANVNSNSSSNESADLINSNNIDKTGGEISHIHTSMLIGLNSFAVESHFATFLFIAFTGAKNENGQPVDEKSPEESK